MSFKEFYTEGTYGYDAVKPIGRTTEGGLYENHSHSYQIDDDSGNGTTSEDAGHSHVIDHWKVVSEHQHIHLLESI